MNLQTFEKLWRKSRGRTPHLSPEHYELVRSLAQLCGEERARYWGLVDSRHRFEGQTVIHCFNFGNTTVKFPWQAEALNFGQHLPLVITASGTVRARRSYRTLLHQIESPFLVFALEQSTAIEEHLQAGHVLAEAGSAELVSEREVLLLPGSAPPKDGILFYFLMRRLPFSAEAMAPVELKLPGMTAHFERFRLKLSDPMLLEPGWIVLMLEKDRWMWGIVLR